MPFDWESLVKTASQHDIGRRLYHSLRACPLPDAAAGAAMAVVEAQYYATGLRNALLERELHRILDDWRVAGAPAIVLKGSALTATVYGNRALRPMRDLDVLVQPSDMATVRELMAASGYEIDPTSAIESIGTTATITIWLFKSGVGRRAPSDVKCTGGWSGQAAHFRSTQRDCGRVQ